jgi:hypothetical protein
VPSALHDPERLVAAHGAPRDPGRAQVVERDRSARRVRDEEVTALDARALKVVLQLRGEHARRGHVEHASGRSRARRQSGACLDGERAEQRHQLLVDGHLARDPGLGALRLPSVAHAVNAAVHVDVAVL